MTRVLLSVALLLVMATSPSPSTLNSIMKLVSDDGHCTAFSINQREGYWLTAAHCLGDVMSINGETASAVKIDYEMDLLLVQSAVRATP
jgi:hypothetical protein